VTTTSPSVLSLRSLICGTTSPEMIVVLFQSARFIESETTYLGCELKKPARSPSSLFGQ
jgi:hypothetical protein